MNLNLTWEERDDTTETNIENIDGQAKQTITPCIQFEVDEQAKRLSLD